MRPKKKPLTRGEVRYRKGEERKKKVAEALEMQRAREKERRAEEKEERAREKDKKPYRLRGPESGGPSGIPEYQEGDPRPGWCTDEDIRKGRSRYDGN